MQFNIELNPGSIMLLYFDCSIWDGLSMHSRMLEGGGKRTLGCQILTGEVRGARNIKQNCNERVLNTFLRHLLWFESKDLKQIAESVIFSLDCKNVNCLQTFLVQGCVLLTLSRMEFQLCIRTMYFGVGHVPSYYLPISQPLSATVMGVVLVL